MLLGTYRLRGLLVPLPLSLYSLKPDGCLVRIVIRHLSIVKNRAQKRNHWHAPSWLYVRPAKKCAMGIYVLIDRGLLMGAKTGVLNL